jgi:hypothetical protein
MKDKEINIQRDIILKRKIKKFIDNGNIEGAVIGILLLDKEKNIQMMTFTTLCSFKSAQLIENGETDVEKIVAEAIRSSESISYSKLDNKDKEILETSLKNSVSSFIGL